MIALLVLSPVLSLILSAFQGGEGLWPHMLAYVLPVALRDTLLLAAGVGILVSVIGAGTAWLVTAYDFPGRSWMEWALLLPLAVPTYIVAYAYLDILHPVGAVQDAIRAVLGYDGPRAFRLPDVRSMGGAIFVMGFVLYPYVYLTVRAMFLTQAATLIEAARTLGTPGSAIFRRVALPLARPAIAVGVSLAVMETLNDIGASEFLGVRTLTISIYASWVSRSDLAGAAQIALAMLVLVVGLLLFERWARRHRRYAAGAQRASVMRPARLRGAKAGLALAACLLPILIGFIVPASYLVIEAVRRYRFAGLSDTLLAEAVNTLTLSAAATMVILACGILLAYTVRIGGHPGDRAAARIAALGYAIPGTVLAIGLLGPLGLVDHILDEGAGRLFGASTGLVLMGSSAALIYAYAVRFLAIAVGGVEAGFSRIPFSIDYAARSLGESAGGALRRVHLPLSRSALAAAGLLTFVDCAKELPATLLLRPLNVETLATHLYGEAARGTYEEASLAALLIVAIGIFPVCLLARTSRPKRERS
ncbi:MAG: iron ABC transporter permease [Rhodospirillaceae bacterium]|nr:iron ABC transporter permease [Rhodospirillaceae bacterium]